MSKRSSMGDSPSRRDALGVGAMGLSAVLGGCVTQPGSAVAQAQTAQAAAPPASEPASTRARRGDGRLLTPTISAYIANIRSAPVNPEFLELGKRHILDTLAAAVSCKDLEPAMLGRKYALAKSADAKAAPPCWPRESASAWLMLPSEAR